MTTTIAFQSLRLKSGPFACFHLDGSDCIRSDTGRPDRIRNGIIDMSSTITTTTPDDPSSSFTSAISTYQLASDTIKRATKVQLDIRPRLEDVSFVTFTAAGSPTRIPNERVEPYLVEHVIQTNQTN